MNKDDKKSGSSDNTIIVIILLILASAFWAKNGSAIMLWLQKALMISIKVIVILSVLALGYFVFFSRTKKKKEGEFSFGKAKHITENDSNIFVKVLAQATNNKKDISNFSQKILYNNSRVLDCNHPTINKIIQKGHQLVLGASGSGKTYSTLQPQARHDIEQGKCLFIIDPKGDTLFSDAIYTYCKRSGRAEDFRYFSMSNIDDSDKFNPFSSPSVNETKDLIVAATEWSEVYYKKMAEVILLEAMGEMSEQERSLSSIISLIPDKKEFTGLKADLKIMKMSEFGKLIDGTDYPTILDFYKQNKVCYFSLDTQSYPEASKQLGKIILGGIMAVSNYAQAKIKNEERKPVTTIVDEFGSFISEPFINFLNKARSANFKIVLATQSTGDLEKYGQEIRKQIADNTSVKIVLAMSDPDSIEYAARLFGTQETIKTTKQIDNRRVFGTKETGTGSQSDAQEFIVHPAKIRRLGQGEGYVMTQNPFSISKVNFKPDPINLFHYSKNGEDEKVELKNENNKRNEKLEKISPELGY